MKELNEIKKEAQESYQTYFKDRKEHNDDAFRGHDIVLDKEDLEKEMESKKETEEKKIKSLEVLRNKLNVEAEKSLKQTFGEEKEVKLVLTKTMTNENTGVVNNRAEIAEDYNESSSRGAR